MNAQRLEPLDTTAQFDDGSWAGRLFLGAGEFVGTPRLRGVGRPLTPCAADDRCHERDGLLRGLRRVRRFVTANRLTLFVTTTFKRSPTVESAVGEMERFLRRCRHGHDAFPFVWTLERGEKRGRLHGHMLAPVGLRATFEEAWSLGDVHSRVIGESLHELRDQAKYLAKGFEDSVMPGQKYRVAKGFAPEAILIEADSREALLAEAETRMGSVAVVQNSSPMFVSAQWGA